MNALCERTLRRRFRQKGEMPWLRVSFLRRFFYLSKARFPRLKWEKNSTPKYSHTRRLTRRFSPQPAEDVCSKNLLVVELLHQGRGTTKSSSQEDLRKESYDCKAWPEIAKNKKPRQKCLTLDCKTKQTTQTNATLHCKRQQDYADQHNSAYHNVLFRTATFLFVLPNATMHFP